MRMTRQIRSRLAGLKLPQHTHRLDARREPDEAGSHPHRPPPAEFEAEAAAAWHAERVVRLCAKFGRGIAGVRVSEEGFIAITVELPGDGLAEASIAVGPDGKCACRTSSGGAHRASTAPDTRTFEHVLTKRLAKMGCMEKVGDLPDIARP